jgi:CheY-like chemotaxis protein
MPTVLIVEHEPTQRTVISAYVHAAGINVLNAATCEQALDML